MTVAKSLLARLPVSLPRTELPPDFDPVALATQLSSSLLSEHSALGDHATYATDASWRDVFALTGTLRTFYGPEGISAAWNAITTNNKFGRVVEGSWHVIPAAAKVVSLPMGECWVEVMVQLEIELPGQSGLKGACTVMVGVCPNDVSGSGEWKVWLLRTILENVIGWPDVNDCRSLDERPSLASGVTNGIHTDLSFTTDVVVVGAGQSGLSVAGRLEALGVKYVLIDSHSEIGDSWGKRYSSARVHTIREYAHLPFNRTFPKDEYSQFLHKDELSRGYAIWARKFGVDKHFRGNTKLASGDWDEETQSWSLQLSVRGGVEQVTCKCRIVVMATGGGGQIPWSPPVPGQEKFKGILMHSVKYTEPDSDWKGKRGIVVGTGNTAHDVADDMLSASMSSVTMIQRGATYVFPGRYWHDFSAKSYNENIPTEVSDKIGMSGPNAVGRLIVKSGMDAQSIPSDQDEYFDSLAKSGFKVERTGDLMWHLLERGGGHYFDMGVSPKIARGEVYVLIQTTICETLIS